MLTGIAVKGSLCLLVMVDVAVELLPEVYERGRNALIESDHVFTIAS